MLMTDGSMRDRVCRSEKTNALMNAALEPVFLTHRQALVTRPTAMPFMVAT